MAVMKPGPKDWSDLFALCPHVEEKVIRALDLESALTCRQVSQSWRDAISEDRKLKVRIKGTTILKAVRMGPISTNLVAKFADVNKAYKSGWTPLGFAAQAGKAEVVKILLSHGADIDKPDKITYYTKEFGKYQGITPLCHAVMNSHKDLVMLLIKSRANVDKKCILWNGKSNLSVLQIAQVRRDLEFVKILSKKLECN